MCGVVATVQLLELCSSVSAAGGLGTAAASLRTSQVSVWTIRGGSDHPSSLTCFTKRTSSRLVWILGETGALLPAELAQMPQWRMSRVPGSRLQNFAFALIIQSFTFHRYFL